MCGVSISCPTDMSFIKYATKAHYLRGPDNLVMKDLGFCSIGINRLAITDLLDGDQPLWSEDGSVVVIFNGAIYNSAELCKLFEFQPTSGNDGEVIHFLYRKFGLSFADYLEGMYSICLVDLRDNNIIVCTDQLGIKPLYWLKREDEFKAASTIQAFPPELRHFVTRVPPGVVWTTSGHSRRIIQRTAECGDLLGLLESSVRQQIPNDVKWGCMLSGGVDSSLITAIAVQSCDEVHSFTCGTLGSGDFVAAREVAEFLGTKHHEILIDVTELPLIVKRVVRETCSFEPWTVMAGIGTFITSRYAHEQDFKVLLSGEGADELFAGYDEFCDVPPPLLEARLHQYQVDLGVTECLRLDRATMANSVEARVPYLSSSLIRYARSLEPSLKLANVNSEIRRKVQLRDCASELLPSHVAERIKIEFKDGSGLTEALHKLADEHCSKEQVFELSASYPSYSISNSLAGWFFMSWLNEFGATVGTDCGSMRARGLFRQEVSDFLTPGTDPNVYC